VAATPEALRSPASADGPPAALYGKLSPGPGKSAAEVAAHQRARIHSAMVEAVADHGYAAVTVREIARLAGVSTRAFYKLFEGKADCFFRTYDLVVKRAAKRIVAAQAGERDWRERLRLGFAAFVRELDREPRAAQLALVEAYVAGPEVLERARRTECMFEAMIAESFSRASDNVAVPPLVIEGIVAGVIRVARSYVVNGHELDPARLGDGLAEWAMSFRTPAAGRLSDLDCGMPPESPVKQWSESDLHDDGVAARPASDRDLILTATAKLVTSNGYDALTVPAITNAAGVPRRSFKAHFPTVEECYLATVEQRAVEVASRGATAGLAARSPEGAIFHVVLVVAEETSTDPTFARLCFDDIHAAGATGLARREAVLSSVTEGIAGPAIAARLASEASAGALWGILHRRTRGNRAEWLPRIAPTLAFLALAPQSGADKALSTISTERVNRSSGLRIENKKLENLTDLEQPAMLAERRESLDASSSRNRNQEI
jgi:AcrR family transcriptional regulator